MARKYQEISQFHEPRDIYIPAFLTLLYLTQTNGIKESNPRDTANNSQKHNDNAVMTLQSVIMAMAIFVLLQVLLLIRNMPETSYLPVRRRPLAFTRYRDFKNVPVEHPTPFPRKIWQTSKNGPAGLDDADKEAIRTWTKLNQKWRYEMITQYGAESYVRESFANRPEIIEAFIDLQDPILRADMIRYLVLLKDGGLYSDMDTKSLKPIEDWIPIEYQVATSVVIGVEYDRLKDDRWDAWTLDLQFTSWSILAKPEHPLLNLVVEKVIRNLKDLAIEQGTTIAKLRTSYNQVLDTTGPAAFSRAVFEYLSQELGNPYTWENVTGLKTPLLVGDILILPITAFGSGQAHSNSQDPDNPTALVQHLFKGSWKDDSHALSEDGQNKDDDKTVKQGEEEKLQTERQDALRIAKEEAEIEKQRNEQEEERRVTEVEEEKRKQEAPAVAEVKDVVFNLTDEAYDGTQQLRNRPQF